MPHVIVRLWPGKSEEQKTRLADRIAKNVMDVLHYGEESVSAGFEEVKSKDCRSSSTNRMSRISGTRSTGNRDTGCKFLESRKRTGQSISVDGGFIMR